MFAGYQVRGKELEMLSMDNIRIGALIIPTSRIRNWDGVNMFPEIYMVSGYGNGVISVLDGENESLRILDSEIHDYKILQTELGPENRVMKFRDMDFGHFIYGNDGDTLPHHSFVDGEIGNYSNYVKGEG
ncbi:MAG: hypothetical protein ABIJ92_02080 [Candidatus Aenigmatarchaeota archaeon]